ncbi:T-complex protein 1 subunit zeta [Myotis davidii]|uniref:T-complex protein 1 subunit zeta n=1 Tax=Myotis davidii TaxID=225400 RepID=L5LL63_MYODS|nr:T-complex protein 1 subunit zeta [Myotis davidii]
MKETERGKTQDEANIAIAQDDITGDGTTSNVLIIGELLKQETLKFKQSIRNRQCTVVGLNTGEPMVTADVGIWDNNCVKKQASLLANEIM